MSHPPAYAGWVVMPTRAVNRFEVISDYEPSGDQPQAITELAQRINAGETDVVLLGATGTGKSATTAWLIEQVQRPTLVLAHNKTLAAQLANEFRELMPNNAVEYFVSYYDYYQPEAYVPQTDTFIEKDSSINTEVERLRHSTTNSLLSRRDVIVVSTVSCIYGLGAAGEVPGRHGLPAGRRAHRPRAAHPPLHRHAVRAQRRRLLAGAPSGCAATRSRSSRCTKSTRSASRCSATRSRRSTPCIRSPATWSGRWMRCRSSRRRTTPRAPQTMHRAIETIKEELEERLGELERQGKLLEAQRLRMRTTFDLEMMEQIGFCNGIENYSRHIDGRAPGRRRTACSTTSPRTSSWSSTSRTSRCRRSARCTRVTRPASARSSSTASACRARWTTGPLRWEEFHDRVGQKVYLSATPGKYEMGITDSVVEQIIRPTGLIDPQIVVKPSKGQIDDLLEQIRLRVERNERVLVTTLTKQMAEELTDFLGEHGVRVRYLHSDVDTLRRVELLTELRRGVYDVLVGINLLREGLDLPEVSLVAILDADKEGFLRSGTSLVQTIGRAARNVSGEVHMYADVITDSMRNAIERDRPPSREAGRVQRGARHRPDAAAQAHRRHHGGAGPRGKRHRTAAQRAQ